MRLRLPRGSPSARATEPRSAPPGCGALRPDTACLVLVPRLLLAQQLRASRNALAERRALAALGGIRALLAELLARRPRRIGLVIRELRHRGDALAEGCRSEEHTSELQSPSKLVYRL